MMKHSLIPAFVFFFLTAASLSAYTTYQADKGPLTLYFGEPGDRTKLGVVMEIDKPFEFKTTFENRSDKPMRLELTFRTIETIELPDADPTGRDTLTRSLDLKARETKTLPGRVVAREGTYPAHYPVRLDVRFEQEGRTDRAQIILVLETKVPHPGKADNPLRGKTVADPRELPLNILPDRGGLSLSDSDAYRAFWYYDGKEKNDLPVGFSGAVPSGGHLGRQSHAIGGANRQVLAMHPPYKGGVGNIGAEYRVRLPGTKPVSLLFYGAVRTTRPPETPSDGVTFRVLVDGKNVYEKHIASTEWIGNRVDLNAYAGKEILLRLESDPGPKRNTNCDLCYWGDVLLLSGEPAKTLSAKEKQRRFTENLAAIRSGKSSSKRTTVFVLDGGLIGAVTFGHHGFLDGVIGLGDAEKQVQFDGLRVWCRGQRIGGGPGAVHAGPWTAGDRIDTDAPPRPKTKSNANSFRAGELAWAQEITLPDRSGTLFFGLAKNGPALELSVDASESDLIDRIEFGPATRHAPRVYFGHGYCVEEPKAFSIGAGGHSLSTSHVGMDFDNGLSVLQATSFPPDRFLVDPESKTYTLSVHPGTVMKLLPGLDGATDCAVRYRPVCGKVAAPGVATKAGRLVFDLWGGNYRSHLETVRGAIRYGLTDSQFIIHSWQHYGYDNRLPDIWPPRPALGTLEEMRQALDLCDEHGIQYGVHDNYIDFYPDADGFDFDVTTFTRDGLPRKAWNNYGIEAQSYQFRPDRVMEFLNRNLDLAVPQLPMSTYFIDVFTSIPPIDYYDRHGNFHSRVRSRACWNEAFDTIRDRLNKSNRGVASGQFASATTSSEAGMDSLIGHLDGADCQFMYLSEEPGEFRMRVACKDWSRVPWFDAVHHTTFSLHGVGYSNRYETGRGRPIHGIESDDYIASEILTGHALMVDSGSRDRGAVRKYWLAQDLIRHLADKEIDGVRFEDGNIRRQTIRWSDGTTVCVNLGEEDWTPPGDSSPILPRYGLAAWLPNASRPCMAIAREKGRVIERSAWKSGELEIEYVNARQKAAGAENLVPVEPKLNSFEYLGGNRFKADFAWDVQAAPDKQLCVFVHCVEKRLSWHQKLKEAVLGGGLPTRPTDQWKGRVVSDALTMTVPDELPAGRYYLVIGLYDQKGDGRRSRLVGLNTGADRYAVGWLQVRRQGGKVSEISCEPLRWNDAELYRRLLPPEQPVEMGSLRTKGAFRVVTHKGDKTTTVTPLPGEPATELSCRVGSEQVQRVRALDPEGTVLRDVPFEMEKEGPRVRFTTRPGEFSYRISWR